MFPARTPLWTLYTLTLWECLSLHWGSNPPHGMTLNRSLEFFRTVSSFANMEREQAKPGWMARWRGTDHLRAWTFTYLLKDTHYLQAAFCPQLSDEALNGTLSRLLEAWSLLEGLIVMWRFKWDAFPIGPCILSPQWMKLPGKVTQHRGRLWGFTVLPCFLLSVSFCFLSIHGNMTTQFSAPTIRPYFTHHYELHLLLNQNSPLTPPSVAFGLSMISQQESTWYKCQECYASLKDPFQCILGSPLK